MKRKFNASISTVGVKEAKVQQALLKLIENSLYIKEQYERQISDLKMEIQILRQTIYSKVK